MRKIYDLCIDGKGSTQIAKILRKNFDRQQTDFNQFRQIVRKYVGITDLTPTIVNKFIKKIIVHAPDKSSGHRVQKIQIVFNIIGEFTTQTEFISDKKKVPQDYF